MPKITKWNRSYVAPYKAIHGERDVIAYEYCRGVGCFFYSDGSQQDRPAENYTHDLIVTLKMCPDAKKRVVEEG